MGTQPARMSNFYRENKMATNSKEGL